jgi:fumarate reductase flavoprotein subunit
MKHLILTIGLSVTAATSIAAVLQATAQVQVPGAGRSFLIDKHVAGRVSCAQCHPKGLATAAPDTPICLACHGGSYQGLAAKTEGEPNPHRSHLGELACAECHHVHVASINRCNQCHMFDMKMP